MSSKWITEKLFNNKPELIYIYTSHTCVYIYYIFAYKYMHIYTHIMHVYFGLYSESVGQISF